MTAFILQDLIKAVGAGLDFDKENRVFGRMGTERIPFLHKEPTTGEDAATAIYETLRASGVTLEANPLSARRVFQQAGAQIGLSPQVTYKSFAKKLADAVNGKVDHTYDRRDVEIEKILLAREIRKEAQNDRKSTMRGQD